MKFMKLDLDVYQLNFLAYLEELKDFHFSFFNPVFWLFWFVLFLILLRFWKAPKSFSFCIVVAAIFLLTTKIEGAIGNIFYDQYNSSFVPWIVRGIALVVIMVVAVYYAIIRGNSYS